MLEITTAVGATVAIIILMSRTKQVSGWWPGWNRVTKFGIVAQLVAQETFNFLVVGSSPTDPTKGDRMTYATLLKTIKQAIDKDPDLLHRPVVIYDSTNDIHHWADPMHTKLDKDDQFAIGF